MRKPRGSKIKKSYDKKEIVCISASDYKKLKEKIDRLERAGDNIINRYVSKYFMDEPEVREWRAAKI